MKVSTCGCCFNALLSCSSACLGKLSTTLHFAICIFHHQSLNSQYCVACIANSIAFLTSPSQLNKYSNNDFDKLEFSEYFLIFTWRKDPFVWDNMAAVLILMCLDDWLGSRADREVFSVSRADPGRLWVPGLTIPDKGRPVAILGRELKSTITKSMISKLKLWEN